MQQLKEIEQSFGALVKQLPNRSEIDALLTDINQAGLGRGLQFELFKPAAQERMADFYAELPIAIRITGNYHDMGAFASDVAQLPRIVTLNDVAITNDKGVLTLDAVAKTFRYLDEEEIAKQRAAQRAKDKGEGQEMNRARGLGGRDRARRSRGAAARATRTCARGWPSRARARAGKLDPLPQIKPYEPFAYNAFDLPDPFKPRKIEPTKGGSKLAPDLDAPPRAARGVSARVAEHGRHAASRTRRCTRWCARRTGTSTRCAPATTSGRTSASIIGITESEIKLEGARAGRRRRLDRADGHAAAAAGRTTTQGRKR